MSSNLLKQIKHKLKVPKFTLLLMVLLLASNLVQAQQRRNPNDPPTGSCAACGAFTGVMILIPIILIVLNIALLIWVARDAKSRGMDSAVLWMILVFFLGPIGLIIYIFSRPKGNLVICSSCKNKRLQASAVCPHCKNV